MHHRLELLNAAFSESSINEESLYKWYKCFQEDPEDVEDGERLGHPNTLTTEDKKK